jgi:uncharacterized RDD family membrane protein YckC
MSRHSRRVDRNNTDVVGARIVAQIVDTIAMTVQLTVVGFLFAIAFGGNPGDAESGVFLALFTLPLYGTVLEGYFDGKTIGKMLTGIKVVRVNGEPCGPTEAFVRNLPAAALPGWPVYLVALASMASSDVRQRVFDRMAETTVVSDPSSRGAAGGYGSSRSSGSGTGRSGPKPPR